MRVAALAVPALNHPGYFFLFGTHDLICVTEFFLWP
jgi:hypothetical protein